MFRTLRLRTFSEKELRAKFDAADSNNSGQLELQEVVEVIRAAHRGRVSGAQLEERVEKCTSVFLSRLDLDKDKRISYDEFRDGIVKLAEQRDARMWPIATSMLVSGMSVGVVVPAMPMLVVQLGLSQAEFGYVVSAFGLSKLLANIPAGVFVDAHGRRMAMALGLGVVGCGMIGIGLAASLEQLIAARFATGIGASFIMTGATMAVADISTPLNRARMLAPVMTAFSAGTVLGPAVGGFFIGSLGMSSTLFCIGGVFFLNAAATRILTAETMQSPASRATPLEAARRTVGQWGPLWRIGDLRAALVVNGAYWVGLAGINMTLVPLLLASQFGLSPAEIGTTFALQAAVSVLSAGPVAWLADRLGPQRLLAPGLACMAASVAALPLAPDMAWAAGPLALNAVGGTMMSSAPTALAANLVSVESRTQAIAMMRTMGDVGSVLGGVTVGTAATVLGTDVAMQGTAAYLLVAAGWYAARGLLWGKPM